MQGSCLQENLNKGLSLIGRIVAGKTQTSLLGNILFSSDKERIRLSATNLEMGVNFWLGAKIEKEGESVVPARPFIELINSFPAGKIDFSSSESLLAISSGAYKASLSSLSVKDFPGVPVLPKKESFFFPKKAFFQAVSQVAFAAAQDEGRPVLTGVKLFEGKEGMEMVATDGYRLSFKKTRLKTEGVGEGVVIPAKALSEASYASQGGAEKEGEVGVVFLPEENQVGFLLGDASLTARLLEGDFPDFSKIIPQEFKTKATLEKEALLKAVKIASIFARESANIVRWRLDSAAGGITLSANSPQVGENSTELEGKIEGESNEIAFNYRYLLDLLNALESEEIVFEMSGPLSPGVFKPLGDDSFLHIIMPVRVQG